MTKFLKTIWQQMPWQIIPLFFGGLFLIRNVMFPIIGDDFAYAFVWDHEHGGNLMDGIGERKRIDSFEDILESQWEHYFNWGGRIFSMIFLQFFAWQGKYLFNIANTLVFLLLIYAIFRIAVGKTSANENKFCLLWAFIGVQYGNIDYPTSMLWMTGACVYLWTGFFVCAFLLPYALALIDKNFWVNPPFLAAPLMAAMGLIAGWSEEGASLAALFILTIILYFLHREKRLTGWMKTGAIFDVIGCLFLILCPGSVERERLMLIYSPEYILEIDKLWTAEMFYNNFTEGFLPIILWESFIFIPIFICLKNRLASKETIRYILIFTAGALFVLIIMMFAPEFGLRTGIHSTIFLTIASTTALKASLPYLKEKYNRSSGFRIKSWILGGVCAVYACFCIIGALYIEYSFNRQWAERMVYIEEHRNDPLITVKSLHIPEKLSAYLGPRSLTNFHTMYGADLESKTTDNRCIMFAQYHGLNKIHIDTQTDWVKRK